MNTLNGASGVLVHTLEYIKQEAEMRYHLCDFSELSFHVYQTNSDIVLYVHMCPVLTKNAAVLIRANLKMRYHNRMMTSSGP
jgi:hypothetical protein